MNNEGWVSVEDTLPEMGETVLCCERKGLLFSGYYKEKLEDSFIFVTEVFIDILENGKSQYSQTPFVTHWMPLPELPND